RFINRFSTYYTPGVVVVAALVAILPPLLAGGDWNEWIYKGLAILLIGCPCALVISTPAAIAAALSSGARRGLLMKGGAVLETIGKITAACFDKTGTLTEGKPKVTDVLAGDLREDEVLRLAASLDAGSSHPLALAIVGAAEQRGLKLAPVTGGKAHGGKGVSGMVGEKDLFLGSRRAASDISAISDTLANRIAACNDEGKTVSVLVANGRIAGAIAMRDEPRADAIAGQPQSRSQRRRPAGSRAGRQWPERRCNRQARRTARRCQCRLAGVEGGQYSHRHADRRQSPHGGSHRARSGDRSAGRASAGRQAA